MTGATIVFIHGNFVTKRCWEPWAARYEARGYTCVGLGLMDEQNAIDDIQGILKKNTGARIKSRLAKSIKKLAAK